MPCYKSNEKIQERIKAMTHEERMKEYENMRRKGFGMIGSGVAIFGGLFGGLSTSMNIGAAFAIAFGASCGLICGSCRPFGAAKEIKAIDKEMNGQQKEEAAPEEVNDV